MNLLLITGDKMKKLGFVYNMDKCLGCKACQMACKDKHKLMQSEFFRRVDNVPYEKSHVHLSLSCNHCESPACVSICTTGAMYKAVDGTVQHKSGLCIGCGKCTWSCPYGAVSLSKTKGIATKCTSCSDLRAKGELPACVNACISHCLEFKVIENNSTILPEFIAGADKTNPSLIIDTKDI